MQVWCLVRRLPTRADCQDGCGALMRGGEEFVQQQRLTTGMATAHLNWYSSSTQVSSRRYNGLVRNHWLLCGWVPHRFDSRDHAIRIEVVPVARSDSRYWRP